MTRSVLADDAIRPIEVFGELVQPSSRLGLGDISSEDEHAEGTVGGHTSGELIGSG